MFDIQTTTEDFLPLLPEFEDHGLDLFQMSRRVPNTLLFNIYDESMNRILLNNGLFLKFILPHAGEVAQLCSPNREYLESLLKNPALYDAAH